MYDNSDHEDRTVFINLPAGGQLVNVVRGTYMAEKLPGDLVPPTSPPSDFRGGKRFRLNGFPDLLPLPAPPNFRGGERFRLNGFHQTWYPYPPPSDFREGERFRQKRFPKTCC